MRNKLSPCFGVYLNCYGAYGRIISFTLEQINKLLTNQFNAITFNDVIEVILFITPTCP